MRRGGGAALAALLLALLLSAPARAVPPAERGEAFDRIEKQVMCIECNVPLNIADAAQADATRTEIRRLLARNLSDQQVLDALVADYGKNILAAPKASGFNAFAYLVPVLALAALLGLGALLLPRWRRERGSGGAPGGAAPAPLSRADAERLDAELARYGA